MKLREALRTIVREVVGEDLRQIVREVLMEELMDTSADVPAGPLPGPNPRSEAAKKAAATRRANKEKGALPKAAQRLGISLGQKWKGKQHNDRVAGRIIEIVSCDATGVVPKVVSSSKAKTAAKHISYEHLRGNYDAYEGPIT